MTWIDPPAWSRTWHEQGLALGISDETGQVQMKLSPYPPPPEQGKVRDLLRVVDDGELGLDRMLWRVGRGVLRQRACPITVPLPDGTAATLHNGATTGWRRRNRHGQITLHGATYDVVHRSRRRSELHRDAHLVAELRRSGWYWSRHRGDGALHHRVRLSGAGLSGDDLLALVVTGSVLGPPGRPGWWAHFWGSLDPW